MKGIILNQYKASEAREKHIIKLLHEYKTSNITFSSMTQLSEHLAKRISKDLNSNISGSTLRRNDKYKILLNKYIDRNKGLTSEKKDITDMSIRLRNLTKTNKGLEEEITLLNYKLSEMEHLILSSKDPQEATIQTAKSFFENKKNDNIRNELINSYTLLLYIMQISHGFRSDIKKGVVINDLDGKTIMTKDKFPTFFEVQDSDFDFK